MAYSYSRSLTIDHTKCGASNSSSFPVLFSGTYSWLATVANSGHVQNANGYDIIFTSDSAGTTNLTWEIESYNATTGNVQFWVNVATVSSSVDTVFYVFYGDATVSTFQSTASSVWDTNYKSVYHLSGAGPSMSESTSNANTATNHATTAITGQIDGGAGFNGSTQYITCGTATGPLDITASLTIESWVKATAFPTAGNFGDIFEKGFDNTNEQYFLRFNDSGNLEFGVFVSGNVSLSPSASYLISGNLSTATWYHLTGVYNGTTWVVYVNGVNKASTTSTAPPAHSAKTPTMGAGDISGTVSRFINGNIDELRVSNSARSVDWLLTSYNNQNSPSTFYTVGAEASTSTVSHFLCLLGMGA